MPTATAAPAPEGALCAGRAKCSIHRRRAAGKDAEGRALWVLTVDLGLESLSDAEPPSDSSSSDLEEEPNQDTTRARYGSCHRFEYWRMVEGAPDLSQLLVTVCNDGYGASGVGEDTVSIGDNLFSVATSGGSAWRWSQSTKRALYPQKTLTTTQQGNWNLGPNTFERTVDWERFTGREAWFSPACNAQGEPPEGEGREANDPGFESVLIPRMTLDPAFRSDGYRTVALGRCAVDVDGTGAQGFVTFGERAARAEGFVRAVLSDQQELFVEVHDPHPSGASARWVRDDHLEIWLPSGSDAAPPPAPGYMDHCLPKDDGPKQWGIRVADGKVFSGYGKPKESDLSVERSASVDGSVHFKVRLPGQPAAMTLGYSDGDGKKQRRVVATSLVRKGTRASLGAFLDGGEQATCRVEAGRLEPVIRGE